MSVNAGKGYASKLPLVHYLAKEVEYTAGNATVSLGWLPAKSAVIGSGVSIAVAFNGSGNDAVDIGFRNSVEGHTADPNAFTETALDLDAAVGHIAGDVVSAANLYFDEPAEVTATLAGTDSASAGRAVVYVTFIHIGNVED